MKVLIKFAIPCAVERRPVLLINCAVPRPAIVLVSSVTSIKLLINV